MTRIALIFLILVSGGLVLFLLKKHPDPVAPPVAAVSYPEEILPVLRRSCAGCHSVNPDLVDLELDLTQLPRPLVTSGQPGNSALWLTLTTSGAPYHRLPEAETELFRRWIITDGTPGVLWSERPFRVVPPREQLSFPREEVFFERLEKLSARLLGRSLTEADRRMFSMVYKADPDTAAREEFSDFLRRNDLNERVAGYGLNLSLPQASPLFENWLAEALGGEASYARLVEELLAGDQNGVPVATHFLAEKPNPPTFLATALLGEPGPAVFEGLFSPGALAAADLPFFTRNQTLTGGALLTTEAALLERVAELEKLRDPQFQNWLLDPERFAAIPDLTGLYPLDEGEGPRESVGLIPAPPAVLFPPEVEKRLASVPGVQGTALRFDGRSLLEIFEGSPLTSYGGFTLAFWFQPGELTATPRVILSAASPEPPADLLLILSRNDLQLSLRDRRNLAPPLGIQALDLSLPPDRWQHLALTYGGGRRPGSLKLFLNGRELAAHVVNTPPVPEVTDGRAVLFLGGRPGSLGFENGSLDEFHLYQRALSEAEIAHLSNLRLLADPTGPIPLLRDYYFGAVCGESRAVYGEVALLRRELAALHRKVRTVSVLQSDPDETDRLRFVRKLFRDHPERLARFAVLSLQDKLTGRSLSETPGDLSRTGALPRDLARLDYLAFLLVDSDWNLRVLAREILRLHLLDPNPDPATDA